MKRYASAEESIQRFIETVIAVVTCDHLYCACSRDYPSDCVKEKLHSADTRRTISEDLQVLGSIGYIVHIDAINQRYSHQSQWQVVLLHVCVRISPEIFDSESKTS